MAIVLNQHDQIVVGFLGAPYEGNGWITLIPIIDPPDEILAQNFLMVKARDGGWIAMELLGAEQLAAGIIVRFNGIANVDAVRQYEQCDVAIKLYHTPDLPIEEYQRQQLIAEGHREYGMVAARREQRNPLQATNDLQNQAQQHPLLAQAAQFSGDDQLNSPVATENEEAQKEFALELSYQLQLQQQQQLSQQAGMTAPKFKPGG